MFKPIEEIMASYEIIASLDNCDDDIKLAEIIPDFYKSIALKDACKKSHIGMIKVLISRGTRYDPSLFYCTSDPNVIKILKESYKTSKKKWWQSSLRIRKS